MKQEKAIIDVLESGVWGTIGPHSLSFGKALAEYTGGRYALVCHSADAAYEAALRSFGARLAALPHGDITVTGAFGAPRNSLIARCVGSEPLFVSCEESGAIDADLLQRVLSDAEKPVRAVTLDYLAEYGNTDAFPLARISEVCRANGVPLILNADGCIGVRHGDQPLTAFADAVVYSFGEGSAIDVGMGGAVVCDAIEVCNGAFAYHNCGRGFDAGCSLEMGAIVGGDLRVTEWVAVAAEEALREGELTEPKRRVLAEMQGQPVFG